LGATSPSGYDRLGVIEHLSADARRALAAAEREARLLRHHQVASEHLLLGLLRVEDSVAAQALRSLGVTYRKARRRIVRLVDVGSARVDGPLLFTPRVREIIGDAFTGSIWLPLVVETSLDTRSPRPPTASAPLLRATKRRRLQADELLFALLAHGEGVAAHVLREFGLDLDMLAVAFHRARMPEAAQQALLERSPRWPPDPPGRG
jgi:ATP-dependent Clp protease ATP-binding subunit ClpC